MFQFQWLKRLLAGAILLISLQSYSQEFKNGIEFNVNIPNTGIYKFYELNRSNPENKFYTGVGYEINFKRNLNKSIYLGAGLQVYNLKHRMFSDNTSIRMTGSYSAYLWAFYGFLGYEKSIYKNKINVFADAKIGFYYFGTEINTWQYSLTNDYSGAGTMSRVNDRNYLYNALRFGFSFTPFKKDNVYMNLYYSQAFFHSVSTFSQSVYFESGEEVYKSTLEAKKIFPNYLSIGIGYKWGRVKK